MRFAFRSSKIGMPPFANAYSSTMNDRMRQLEAEKQALQKAEEVTWTPRAVMVHPNLAELYRRRMVDLQQFLADPELRSEAMALIHSMITEIKVAPRDNADGVLTRSILGDNDIHPTLEDKA